MINSGTSLYLHSVLATLSAAKKDHSTKKLNYITSETSNMSSVEIWYQSGTHMNSKSQSYCSLFIKTN